MKRLTKMDDFLLLKKRHTKHPALDEKLHRAYETALSSPKVPTAQETAEMSC
jgi:hypothetical protein